VAQYYLLVNNLAVYSFAVLMQCPLAFRRTRIAILEFVTITFCIHQQFQSAECICTMCYLVAKGVCTFLLLLLKTCTYSAIHWCTLLIPWSVGYT